MKLPDVLHSRFAASFSVALGLMIISGPLAAPLFAHHGSVAYDNSHAVVLKQATVTKVNWANPHILVLFDAKDSKGVMRHWAVEGGGPSAVNASGWTKDAVQPGDVITVYLYQAKNGAFVGRTGKLVLADGRVFGTGELGADRAATCADEFGNGGNEAAACRPGGVKTNNKE